MVPGERQVWDICFWSETRAEEVSIWHYYIPSRARRDCCSEYPDDTTSSTFLPYPTPLGGATADTKNCQRHRKHPRKTAIIDSWITPPPLRHRLRGRIQLSTRSPNTRSAEGLEKKLMRRRKQVGKRRVGFLPAQENRVKKVEKKEQQQERFPIDSL